MPVSVRRDLKNVVGECWGLPEVEGAGVIMRHGVALSGGQRRGARKTQQVSESRRLGT